MRLICRMICRFLLCSIPWVAQAAPVTTDVVSSASSYAPLPPPALAGTTSILAVGDARIYLFIEGRSFDLSSQELQDWVRQSAEIVMQYYDGFPVTEVHVAIRGVRGSRVMNGMSIGSAGAGAVVNVDVGLSATPPALAEDWIMVHELVHLAFPSVPRRHHWIEEGLSVYVESIARANAGVLSGDAVWAGFLDGMPRGLPRPGDKGLDNTSTWGRTYWGGALFCLLADISIRERTDGQKTLRDGLRAIVAAGYDMTRSGDIRAVLRIADRATGTTVLLDLYDEMRSQPVPAELDSLWLDLGVAERNGEIIYNNNALQAGIRRALTQRDER
jgi:hypothetical protein